MLPLMTYHGRVGSEFRHTVENGASAAYKKQLNNILERLKTAPLRTKDMQQFKMLYLKMIGAAPAHIISETNVSGRDNSMVLGINDLSLMIPEHDTNAHMFCANSYKLERFSAHIGIRPFPLGIGNAAHLAMRKISRTPIVFHYDEKFTFVLGAALLMHKALSHESVSDVARQCVFIPTSKGLYGGGMEKVDFPKLMQFRNRCLILGRNKVWKKLIMNTAKATDIPDTAIMLRTSIGLSDCGQDKKDIYQQLYAILSPAKNSGLLKTLCLTYEENGEAHQSALTQAQPLIEALVTIINGPTWQRSAARRAESIKDRPPKPVFG